MSLTEKVFTLATGVQIPRPVNSLLPKTPFQDIIIKDKVSIPCWKLNTEEKKGTIVLFHGYVGKKSAMLDKAIRFQSMGYSVLLVDFRGCGDSKENYTTIGFDEAEEVLACYNYLKESGEENIILFGTSMGAVAIMKAIHDYQIDPAGLILECPFGRMYTTVKARFKLMGLPSFPMAGLLTFWGGVQHGFWAFSHNPEEYAQRIKTPTLLLYGEKDDRVSREETDRIFNNLEGRKTFKTYPLAGHENYLLKYSSEWDRDIREFLDVR